MASFNGAVEGMKQWNEALRSPTGEVSSRASTRPKIASPLRYKCNNCIVSKTLCTPAFRVWRIKQRQKCDRCIKANQECGPPIPRDFPPRPPQQHGPSGPSQGSLRHGYPHSPRLSLGSSTLHMQNGIYPSYASTRPSPQHLTNGGPPPRAPEHPFSQSIEHMHLYQESLTSAHDDQGGGPSERGEGLTLQVQEKLSPLSLSLGKKSSSFEDNTDSGSGFGDSVGFSKIARTFGLTARKNWNSSDSYAQISSTISKDNTEGECARQAKLLAYYSEKIKPCISQYDFTTSQASAEPVYTVSNGTEPRLHSVPAKDEIGGSWRLCPNCDHDNYEPDSQCLGCGLVRRKIFRDPGIETDTNARNLWDDTQG